MRKLSPIGQRLVEETFKKQRILVHLGCKIQRIDHGEVELYLPKSELSTQHHGFIHGGIITTLADTAAGLSGFSLLDDPDHTCITVELKINFMRPGDTDLISIGKLLKENRSFMVTTAEVLNIDGKLCAYMLQTIKRIRPGDLVKRS
jgi:uncharacterized protein (TIGR00369 family)